MIKVSPTTILLIRHGEVEGNSGAPVFSGWNDVELTARGETQARALGEYLKKVPLRAVHSSDLQRAHRTAQAIAAHHNLPLQTSAAWRETNYGAWSGLSESDLQRDWKTLWAERQQNSFGVAPPEGESGPQVWARVFAQWGKLVAEMRAAAKLSTQPAHGATVLVAHNGPLRLLLCHLLGAPLEHFRRIKIENCSLSIVDVGEENAAPLLRCINQTSHLEGV